MTIVECIGFPFRVLFMTAVSPFFLGAALILFIFYPRVVSSAMPAGMWNWLKHGSDENSCPGGW